MTVNLKRPDDGYDDKVNKHCTHANVLHENLSLQVIGKEATFHWLGGKTIIRKIPKASP